MNKIYTISYEINGETKSIRCFKKSVDYYEKYLQEMGAKDIEIKLPKKKKRQLTDKQKYYSSKFSNIYRKYKAGKVSYEDYIKYITTLKKTIKKFHNLEEAKHEFEKTRIYKKYVVKRV